MSRLILIGCLSAILCGCVSKGDVATTFDGFALGTSYHIVVRSDRAVDLSSQIDSLLDVANRSMSIYSDSSLISRINRNETDSVNRFIADCIELAAGVSRESDGLYDITVKPLSEAWGFAAREKSKNPNIDSLLQFVGYEKVTVQNGKIVKQNPGTQLDLNSIAKGYIVDLVAEFIGNQGIENYLVEIGGEINCRGMNPKGKPWGVAIDQPIDGNYSPGDSIQVVLEITDVGLATSGNYRRFYIDESGRKIAHTINPKTGRSEISNLLSATIIAKNCALADAYGTMMMAVGLDRAKQILSDRDDILGYLIYSDEQGNFKTYCSPALEKQIRKR